MNEKLATIEALLFAWGEPMTVSEIAQVLESSEKETRDLLQTYETLLLSEERGLRLLQTEKKYQLSTKPEYFEKIKEYAKDNQSKRLSNAALETLSIVAYKQPILKTDIDEIRGVKSDQVIRNLVEAELIEVKERLEIPGRPKVYRTTEYFLHKFGLRSLEDLPEEVEREQNFLEEE